MCVVKAYLCIHRGWTPIPGLPGFRPVSFCGCEDVKLHHLNHARFLLADATIPVTHQICPVCWELAAAEETAVILCKTRSWE